MHTVCARSQTDVGRLRGTAKRGRERAPAAADRLETSCAETDH